ncbi:E3 ubiquitin-protein ligase RNF213-like [Mytilus californianus]|uniref:E3 ubiquitin-protein ligase RNF213-like n=1 Tax=Mytilus californianus TaxID=6549 RepID=UPI002245643A|nr:E3 ubiquitin-protein ligase RNF213-like [Mytilus californianus]
MWQSTTLSEDNEWDDTESIENLTNVEETSMKRLDRGLLNTCSILREITKERADCLKELISCKALVQWLQKTMKGGLKELQVFVDLASISAGEGDMEIAKVNCLHSATTGYAPLIFNLRQECDTEEFLNKCQDVWNDLDSNPQLPQKLRDTSRQIRWLKSVEEFHGAAEVTTLSQAEAINKRGVYQIGNLTRTPFVENPALSDVIDLQVRHKEGRSSKKDKYYRYEQLHDLQSRLMLVAGKAEQGKDDVERFMLTLDSIVRLGSIYVKLISDGCILFSHWRIRIVCDPGSTVCAFILFGSDEESQAIRTRIDEKIDDVSLLIQELARFFEQCHNKWLDYIDQTRDKYFGLNYFTVDQMVILQKELVKVGFEARPSPLVYSLLSAVKRGCTKDDLTKAISSAKTTAIKTVTKGAKSRHNDIQGGKAWCKENEDYLKKPTHKEMTQKQTDDTLVSITENIFRRLDIKSSHCGIKDPSWSEIYHFVSFLNRQLEDFEASAFCGKAAQEDLPGFSDFVLTCLLQMSRDFATRSLVVSEETPMQMMQRHKKNENGIDIIQQYQMRRTWETSPHPYLFFNPDHHSMTFLGFNIERRSGNLVDHQTRKVLEQQIMTPDLFDALEKNDVNLAENFDILQRPQKIAKLCQVMGLETVYDPDETYELTTDNVKKILAIYMRFRCGIPVIIMGETGCGKTRLVKFMCSLQQPPGVDVENMILMKVHGGTKSSDIIRKVRDAEDIASRNTDMYPNMFTVLFFDEANTTEAIGVIKEMMCDKSLDGKPMKLNQSLKIVAACNPYRKHSDELIQRLEQAGLGYHVASDKTTDTIGRVPMRRLVYRVQPLPQSMLPLVWDFGQLTADVEKMYIRQMVLRYIKNGELPSLRNLDGVLSDILTASQDYMRNQKDECSFVSLRDVERTLQVMSWFKKQSQTQNLLFRKMTQQRGNIDPESDSDDEIPEIKQQQEVDDVTRAFILAIGVSYHACLKNRNGYRKTVAKYFKSPLKLKRGADEIEQEISKCQSVFLDSVKLAPNIAKNQALKENVFMMIVCIEMRIPMFLVGKPGSSKSLAKTIVSDSMQGNAAQDDIFKTYKQVQMVSYQCSPLSVPEGIIGAFRQCASYQRDKDLDRYVSVVVLDEVGLAEDSPRMPLKTLHPLLEDGCIDDENQEKYKKVAFIGISNWSLDPAKMNRGILVQRDVPDITELIESAEGICCTNRNVLNCIKPLIQPLAESYLDLFQLASAEMREFFGLRDFYSLIKMLYAFASKSEQKPTWLQLQHCILRNFGGLDTIKPVDIFCRKVIVERYDQPKDDDPDNSPPGLIQACLIGDKISNSETRYLLLLTENYGALTILQQKIFAMENVMVIFGSSFPSDQEYTQICRNINSVKVCMETGSTVILLNLENLYESLYDALNQYYVEFGGERYVDLGLGTHRVKCRVHKKFRLIVVAEKQIVYDKFPIPLINRLEKHFLSLKTMLTAAQLQLTVKLQEWAHKFCEVKVPLHMRHLRPRQDAKKINEAFIGYHADACAAIILHACQEKNCTDENIVELEEECGAWHSVHIDDVHPEDEDIPTVAEMYVQSVGDLLYPVINESQDKSDKTEDVEIPADEGLSSKSLKDEEEPFITEEQETDQFKSENSSNALELERLNDFIADRDTQTEAEPKTEAPGSWNGLLLPRDISGLLSKESRSKWEEQFAKRYIEPFLQDVKPKLSACNQMLLDDQRLGTDILMQILYETDKYPHRKDIQNLQEIPAMWRYRELITIKHLMQNLEGTERTMPVPVLRLFLQEDYHLRAIRFIPSIMRLQRMLIQKYNRKLDRTEIAALTIRDVKREMKEDGRCEDFEQLLKEFEMAWTCVKDLLKNWVCPVDGKLVVVDETYLRSEIADNATKVSYLIPSYRDAGLCSYILLFFLIKHHNLFLQNISSRTNIPIDRLPTVNVKDISSAHLISYHPDKDLLPMVFANCNYSFEVGQGTRIEYNFTNLERQLTDRFLFSKSIVTGLEEIETITYRSESTNAVVFLELCEKVKQERLNPAVRSQICGEVHMRNLPELCDSLDNLDITISFLKSVGSNPNMSLSDFMENTLKIDKPLISTKAKTASKCKHAMSLWISFALERAKQLAKYDRKAFEGVSESFKMDLTMEQIHEVEEMLARSPAEQINTLLELIFECIVFKIDVPQNINDEDYIDISQISFRDQLCGYIDTSPFEEDLQIDDSLMVVIGQMPSDMDDQLRILTAQSVDFWHVVNRCRQKKMR